MEKTLLLDSSYYPIQLIDWKKALTLFFTQRAEVVENHDGIFIHSTNQKFNLPKVMRLFTKFGAKSHVKFNRVNVFYRDSFTCQYCYSKFHPQDLTLDHVYPKSKGGATDWDNIVTACRSCNNEKADKTLSELKITLKKKPKEPTWIKLTVLKLTDPQKRTFKDWFGID